MWALFDEVAAEVRRAVHGSDRLAAGERAGQYGLDLAADAVVVERLTGAGLGVLSEESGRHGADRAVCVVVDPVDGSTNASRGLPSWATSLCAVDADGPWVATVVDHSRGVTYRAARGEGAWRAEASDGGAFGRIFVADPVPLDEAIVAVNGWPPRPLGSRQFRALGAASVELCLVAEGALDGYVNHDADSHGAWDYLGGVLMVAEAGGVAVDRQGRDLAVLDHDARRTVISASSASLVDGMMVT